MTKKYQFAHLADLHLGGWRENTLTDLNFYSFKLSIDKIIEKQLDFVIFAGDIFNSAMPSLDLVQKATEQMLRLKQNNIPLYIIGGSHDYSNSGKSFLDLLEQTGVFENVAKWKILSENEVELELTKINDDIIISGILGKKKGLDKVIYKNLNSQTIPQNKFSIFCFHTTLNDLKPDYMAAVRVDTDTSMLPRGFNYYCGGHVHSFIEGEYSNAPIRYPGPLFPNNFAELKREKASFLICTIEMPSKKISFEREFIDSFSKCEIKVDFKKEIPQKIYDKVVDKYSNEDVVDKIVLLEISGIVEGKVNEINLKEITSDLYQKGAKHVLKNTRKLTSAEMLSVESVDFDEPKVVEKEVISNLVKEEIIIENEKEYLESLLSLNLEKLDEEKSYDFEDRVNKAIESVVENK